MLFGEKILDYWDDILKDLATVVAIPSVAKPQEGEHPFGDQCARALDTVVAMAEGYGLKAKNVGYHAAHAEYGEGEGNAVVMAHLDVVPAGEGWDTDPYTMVIDDNLAFGRGVSDNKGPAIVALHCLRALKDAGVKGNRKLRVIFGSAEEIGMDDMPYYFEREQKPDMGFTPDASYGICHCEKGHMGFEVHAKNDSAVVKSFEAGTVSNAVPFKAECALVCSPEEVEKLQANAAKSKGMFEVAPTQEGCTVLCHGKAAHAASPEDGVNAAAHLVELLCKVFKKDQLGSFFRFIHEKIGLCTDGEKIGVKMSDEPSGPLTFNLGLVHVDGDACSLTVDIRYPATKQGAEISATLKEQVESCGVEFVLLSDAEPLYLPKESPWSACWPARTRTSPARRATSSPWAAAPMPGRCSARAWPLGPASPTRRTAAPTRPTSSWICGGLSCTPKSAWRPCTACSPRSKDHGIQPRDAGGHLPQ